MTVPVYTPTNIVGEVPFLHDLLGILYIFLMIAILTGVRQYFIAFVFCIFIIISNTQHLFICFLTICMSFLEKYLFLIDLLLLLFYIELHDYLCTLEINPLPVTLSAKCSVFLRFCLFTYVCILISLGCGMKMILLRLMSESVQHVFL